MLALTLSAPALAAAPGGPAGKATPVCRQTRPHVADASGLYHGKPLTPHKLTELPPAKGYMAVYRRIDGCEYPMTMVEYRSGQRR
jgi:hypothetical protein